MPAAITRYGIGDDSPGYDLPPPLEGDESNVQLVSAPHGDVGGNWLAGVIGLPVEQQQPSSAFMFNGPTLAGGPSHEVLGAGALIGSSLILAKEAEPAFGIALTLTFTSKALG